VGDASRAVPLPEHPLLPGLTPTASQGGSPRRLSFDHDTVHVTKPRVAQPEEPDTEPALVPRAEYEPLLDDLLQAVSADTAHRLERLDRLDRRLTLPQPRAAVDPEAAGADSAGEDHAVVCLRRAERRMSCDLERVRALAMDMLADAAVQAALLPHAHRAALQEAEFLSDASLAGCVDPRVRDEAALASLYAHAAHIPLHARIAAGSALRDAASRLLVEASFDRDRHCHRHVTQPVRLILQLSGDDVMPVRLKLFVLECSAAADASRVFALDNLAPALRAALLVVIAVLTAVLLRRARIARMR